MLTVAGQTFTITQSGAGTCIYSIKPLGQTFGLNGGNGSVTVSTQTGCSWTAVSSVAWVTIASGSSSGSGNGSVSFTIAANAGTPRTGTLTIAGQTYTVTQSASACGATDVSNKISVSRDAFLAGFLDNSWTETVTLSNNTGQTIAGPVYLVMDGLPRTGGTCTEIGVTNPTCNVTSASLVTFCQSPNGSDLVMFSSGPMTSGQSIKNNLSFLPGPSVGTLATGFNYTFRVFSGTPTQ
jgi:hypothetical protein